jgi:uncharacterized protein DUF5818
MRPALVVAVLLLASAGRCRGPEPGPPPPEPKPGDAVEIRGRLGEDVDCRVLRAEGGKVYSLSERLQNYRDGTRVCVHGTIAVAAQCMRTPGIEVSQVRPWSSCH